MGRQLKAVDLYIAKSAPFAQPLLKHLRQLVHQTCPEVTEVIKWGMPHFDYQGPLFYMAAFKQHMAFGFWKYSLIVGKDAASDEAMGQFGRIATRKDLPADATLRRYLKKGMQLNEEGIKLPRSPRPEKSALKLPEFFSSALRKNARARLGFEALGYGARKEYVEWLVEAKRLETRERRLETTLEWLAAGKKMNWRYERKK